MQPWPPEAPTQLIIWGTDFGDIVPNADPALGTPQIHFGTESTPLVVAADQGLCYAPLGDIAPPLEEGADCVVVDLPDADDNNDNGVADDSVPSGDYLLAIWVELDEVACLSKPSSLTFQYLPADCSASDNSQAGAACLGDDLTGAGVTNLSAEGHNNADWDVDPPSVDDGDFVTFTADGPK